MGSKKNFPYFPSENSREKLCQMGKRGKEETSAPEGTSIYPLIKQHDCGVCRSSHTSQVS